MRVMMKCYPDVYTSTLNLKRSLVSIDATEKKNNMLSSDIIETEVRLIFSPVFS